MFVFSCKNTNCLKQYTEEDMMKIFTKLYNMQTKTEQDIYIQSLMEICPIERERPRPEASSRKPRNFNVRYHVVHNGIRTQVCKEGFLQTYGYTSKQCTRLANLLQRNETPTDKRGTNVSGNAIPGSVLFRLREHIESFPTKLDHYTGKERRYVC